MWDALDYKMGTWRSQATAWELWSYPVAAATEGFHIDQCVVRYMC